MDNSQQNQKNPLDKESHPLEALFNDEEAFFRWFQKKYVFSDPSISISAGRIAEQVKEEKRLDEQFRLKYETKTDIRKPSFNLGETQGKNNQENSRP